MIRVDRELLEIAAAYIDTNNPKYELNYLYIDAKNMVSTNTRAMAIVKHWGDLDAEVENFYIHKSVVDLALKQRKALSYDLGADMIVCLDKDDREIYSISKRHDNHVIKYPAYDRIVPTDVRKAIPFVQHSHIDGILALNKVLVEVKYIPKVMPDGDCTWYVGINDNTMPIVIFDKQKDMQVIIMPIVDTFEMFRELKEKEDV